MKKLLIIAVTGLLLTSCQKENVELPGDPDVGAVAKKIRTSDVYENTVDQVVYNSCTEEYILLTGTVDCKYTTVVDGDITKFQYTLEFKGVEGVGEMSGYTYYTTYKHKATVIADFSQGGLDILRHKEKAKLTYTCSTGQVMTLDVSINFKADKHGNVKVADQQYAVESCN